MTTETQYEQEMICCDCHISIGWAPYYREEYRCSKCNKKYPAREELTAEDIHKQIELDNKEFWSTKTFGDV